MAIKNGTKHFNDWPNTQGFDVDYEERVPVELQVEGHIPSYAAGVLFRTGLGPRTVSTKTGGTFKVNHWFDNLSQVHRFQIRAPEHANGKVKVTYNSRLTSDGLIKKIRQTGRHGGTTFAAKYDPCVSFFQKLQSVFMSHAPEAPSEVNVGVTISPNFPGLSSSGEKMEGAHSGTAVETICMKTDNSIFQALDPQTLEPIGVAKQETLHPLLKGPLSGAHAKFDPVTGDVFNYNLDFGRQGTYRIFTVSAATGKTSILATISHAPAYIHSIFLTEHHVVLCVWNSHFRAGGAAILWKQNMLDAMTYNASTPATWFVVDRKPVEVGGKGHVATYESDPFFSFHSVNAYEEPSPSSPDQTDIVADITAYSSMDCLNRFYIDNLLSDSASALPYSDPSNMTGRPTLQRFRLQNVSNQSSRKPTKTVCEFKSDSALALELPTINGSFATRKHRYVYGTVDTGKSTFMDSLVKYDTLTHISTLWSVHGHTAGEPIFVADPDSDHEDAGVLLSVILDGVEGRSYLLVLNAKDMQEMGRAKVDGVVGFGFHGTHVSSARVDNWGA